MKKFLIALPLIALLTACGTTDPYAKRADAEREREERMAEKAFKQTPSWFKDAPRISNSAVYAYGMAESKSREHSEFLAKNFAYGKICMSAGGTVSKRGRVYQTNDNTVSEQVIVSACNKTDITGIEPGKKEVFLVGTKYYTYVEIVLPTGDANILRKTKEQAKSNELAMKRSADAFKEVEQ
jgi:hypothetical protein